MIDDEAWDGEIVKALDEDGNSTWKAAWSNQRLAKKKAEIGSEAFAQEFQNDPTTGANNPFKKGFLRYYVLSDIEETKPNGEQVE
jgi:hypothetical protein